LLWPERETGIEKTAPWQLLSDALVIETAPGSVNTASVFAATSSVKFVWLAKLTPVEALQAAPAFDVIVPVPVTEVTRTG